MLWRDTTYQNIYFTGGAYMVTYSLGAVLCLIHNAIRFERAHTLSAGIVPAMAMLCFDDKLVRDLFVCMMHWRFASCYFFGMNHMTDSMYRLLERLLQNYPDIAQVLTRMSVCAFNVWRWTPEYLVPESVEEFYHVCAATTRLVPFASIAPYRYKGEHYIDCILWDSSRDDIVLDVCVATSAHNAIPANFTVKNQRVKHAYKLLLPSLQEMVDAFVDGYNDMRAKISDAVAFDAHAYAQSARASYLSGQHMFAVGTSVDITPKYPLEYAYWFTTRVLTGVAVAACSACVAFAVRSLFF